MIDAINAVVPMEALAGVEIWSFHAGASRQNRTIQTECSQGSEQTRDGDPDGRCVIIVHGSHLGMIIFVTQDFPIFPGNWGHSGLQIGRITGLATERIFLVSDTSLDSTDVLQMDCV
jgi:hypothetical protein